MERNFGRLADGPFDLLVIGGGIYGAWTAGEASRRGLKVAIVDKSDWASGTSSASSKLIHGGLRYLEHFRFGLVRKSLRERALLTSLAPHLVRPARFLIPLYRGDRVGSLRLRAGLSIYDLLSGRDCPGGKRVVTGKEETLSAFPFLREEGLLGAISYGDCITDDARFTLEVLERAALAGAVAVNYAEATDPLPRDRCAGGARIMDVEGEGSLAVKAAAVVNTAGPWVTGVAGCGSLADAVRLTKGIHIVFPPLPTADAFLFLTRRDGRVLFLIPWHGKTLVGTTDTDFHGDPDRVRVEEQDVDYLLEELDRVLRPGTWDRSSILGTTAGLRALVEHPGRPASSLSREWRLHEPLPGLFVSVGGKFSSARSDAVSIVERVLQRLDRRAAVGPAAVNCPLPRSPGEDMAVWKDTVTRDGADLGLDSRTAGRLAMGYGTAAAGILALIRKDPALRERLVPELPYCRAEVVFGAEHEMAVRLEDLLRRRLPLMLLAPPDHRVAAEAASLAAPVLGWSEERKRREIEAVMQQWRGALPARRK